MTKTLQPTFLSSVKVSPSHSPPASIPKESEPFFQPTGPTGTDSSAVMHQSASQPGSDSHLPAEPTGKDFSASQYQSSSQLRSDRHQPRSSSPKHTGTDSAKHQSTIQLKPDRHRPRSSSPRRTGSDSSVTKDQSASQPQSDPNRHSEHSGTDPSAIRHQSD